MFRRVGTLIALLFVSLLITVGFPSLAQMAPSNPPASGQNPASQGQINPVDRQYMLDANRNAVGAIGLGQMALQKATQSEVKQFAQAEIDEQVQVKNTLTQLAPRLGVSLPSTPTPKDQEVARRMSQLSGASFDQAVMNELGINAHLENAAIYQREAALGQNQDLVALSTKGISIIDRHYRTASALTGYQVARVPSRVGQSTSSMSMPGMSAPRTANPQSGNTPTPSSSSGMPQ